MGKALHKLGLWMDDFTIKKKFYIFYVVCVLIPLIVTDSVVFLTTAKFDRERREHEMSNIASAVEYSLSSMIGNAGEIGNSIYTNRDFEEFLSKRYTNSAEYVAAYQNFLSGKLLENALGMNSMIFTLYTDNDTIVNGGRVNTLDKLKNTESYLWLNEEAKSKGLFFVYDDSSSKITRERRIIYLQRLDFYDAETEKYLKIEFDYGSMVRTIKNMNYDNEVLICEGDRILLSNGQYGSYGSEFQRLDNATMREAYEHTISLYGTELTIYVKPVEDSFLTSIRNELPIILLLLAVNVIFPFWFVQIFNRSFTKRITELSKVFKSVDSDHLIPMPCEEGKDEISSMIRNYNRMVERTNGLIETVYKNKIHEQEMLVGRKNAELLALHSQINPHFLYNTLESIRSEANACVHGIESKSSPGWIFVRIGRQGEGLEIEIEDTGSGMAEAKLTELQNNMCNADIEMLKGGGRVGIINACVRLKMVTENRVEFRVEGEEGVGTTVTIRIPCLQEGKTDAESIAGR